MNKTNCWVVIAAYNEERHIADVVERTRKQGFTHVVVVDDGSADKTEHLAKKAGAIVLRHIVNVGKGAAMKTGCDYAFGNGAKAVILMDGDGQHKPEELPRFVKELKKHDIVFSYRKRVGRMPLVRAAGGWSISKVIRIFYNFKLQDALCGYRALSEKAYRKVRWTSRDYSVETEMIARAGKNILEYTEIEISTIYHDKYKGMSPIDGVKLMFDLIWWRITH